MGCFHPLCELLQRFPGSRFTQDNMNDPHGAGTLSVATFNAWCLPLAMSPVQVSETQPKHGPFSTAMFSEYRANDFERGHGRHSN